MRHCDLQSDAARINKALEDLLIAWQKASDDWSDEVSRRFCEEHLDPLVPSVKTALDAVSRMDLLLRRAQEDCEE